MKRVIKIIIIVGIIVSIFSMWGGKMHYDIETQKLKLMMIEGAEKNDFLNSVLVEKTDSIGFIKTEIEFLTKELDNCLTKYSK